MDTKHRRRAFVIIYITLIWIILTFCGCGKQKEQEISRSYTVTIQDSVFFTSDVNSFRVNEGGECSFVLEYEYGYRFESCNAKDYRAEAQDGKIRLTIMNVQNDLRLKVNSDYRLTYAELTGNGEASMYNDITTQILYYANGGKWSDGKETKLQTDTRSYHFRTNTLTGEGLSREGYILAGWNTAADGSGEHIGLGSRTDATELYAEWLKSIDSSLFTYKRIENGIALTGYKGKDNVDPFVIPSVIDGMQVVQIDTSFTTNIPCKKLVGKTLVLPETMKTVKSGAFKNAEFTEIYFYDTLESIEDTAFSKPLTTYHINARSAPVFQESNELARFADKLDWLLLSEGERMVLFGGCSVSYGLNSAIIDEAFPDMTICNMGVIGGVNAAFQMQIIGCYLREGDVFVHLPEEMSPYQLMSYSSLDHRMFIMVEGNYDLLALADFSDAATFWAAYCSFVNERNEQKGGSYSDGRIVYNPYGDICVGRPFEEENAWERDVTLSDGSYTFDMSLLTEKGIGKLCDFYDGFAEKGVYVIIGYAPINRDGIADMSEVLVYEESFTALLEANGYHPMGRLSDHIFAGRYFYDSDYHLNDVGVILNTKQLICEITEYIGQSR